MTMHEAGGLLFAALAGVALGVLFFAGLRWTVVKGLGAAAPAWVFIASSVLRTAAVLAGFYWVGGAEWAHLIAALIGFTLARVVVLRVTRNRSEPLIPSQERRAHAPHA